MKVAIYSDVVCPWCAIGKRRFESAMSRFEHADEVEVEWRAFELDPNAPRRREGDYVGRLARKYGISREQAVAANENLTAMAAAEGLEFHFADAKPGNTFNAHRLLHFARGLGLQDALKERLFVAYFTEGEPIGEHDTLVLLAAEVGLDPVAVREVLESEAFAAEVRADEADAQELGVSGVPFFVVDGRFGIPGAQDADTILGVLNRAWDRAHPLTVITPDATVACEGDNCTV